jgi:hypothetical protein
MLLITEAHRLAMEKGDRKGVKMNLIMKALRIATTMERGDCERRVPFAPRLVRMSRVMVISLSHEYAQPNHHRTERTPLLGRAILVPITRTLKLFRLNQ